MDYWEATTKRNRINQKATKTMKRLAASEKCRNINRATVSTGAQKATEGSGLTGPWGEYCNAKSKNNHILLPPSLLTKTCSRMSMNASLCKLGLCEHIFHSGAPQICISFVLLDAPHEWGIDTHFHRRSFHRASYLVIDIRMSHHKSDGLPSDHSHKSFVIGGLGMFAQRVYFLTHKSCASIIQVAAYFKNYCSKKSECKYHAL